MSTHICQGFSHFKVVFFASFYIDYWSKSQIPKSPFTKSPFAERPMLKRALFIGNQLGLVSVYTSVENDKKKFWIGFK